MTGIYKITNIINKKMYIGKAYNIENRWKKHYNDLNKNIHNNKHLQNSWNEWKEENFKFEILHKCDKEMLNDFEEYFIRYYNTNNRQFGFNGTKGGDGGDTFTNHPNQEAIRIKRSQSSIGRKSWNKGNKNCFSPETLEKISKANIGSKRTPEQCINISNSLKGKKRSKAICLKLSELRKGKASTKKEKHYINQSNCQKGEKGYWYGKHRSEKTKQKISNFYKTKGHSQEALEKMSQVNIGKIQSKETREKISAANKGRKVSDETKQKLALLNTKNLSNDEINQIIILFNSGESITNICKITKNCYEKIKQIENKYQHLITEESKILKKQKRDFNAKIGSQYSKIKKNISKFELIKQYFMEHRNINEIFELLNRRYLKETLEKIFLEIKNNI